MPGVHETQAIQRIYVEREQELILKLQYNFGQEQEAERTGIQRPLLYDPPEDLDQKYLEQMSNLLAQQVQAFTTTRLLRDLEEPDEDVARITAMGWTASGEIEQKKKDLLEYYQELQRQLAQRITELKEPYQAYKNWKNRI